MSTPTVASQNIHYCPKCKRPFRRKSVLITHIRNKICQSQTCLEAKMQPETIGNAKLSKPTQNKPATEGGQKRNLSSNKSLLTCPHGVCKKRFFNYVALREHLIYDHDMKMELEKLQFKTMAEFETWKCQVEKESRKTYYLDTNQRMLYDDKIIRLYNCRSEHTGQGEDHLQDIITPKPLKGMTCPAQIEVTIDKNDLTLSVLFWKNHCGHPDEIFLSQLLKKKLARILEHNIPLDDIIKAVRENKIACENSEQAKFLTKRDLINIAKEFNIDCEQFPVGDSPEMKTVVVESIKKKAECLIKLIDDNSLNENNINLVDSLLNKAITALMESESIDLNYIDGSKMF